MLAAIGDLLDDVVVSLGGPVRLATDTDARIVHRRGGSAANVVATAARLDGEARFLGRVGDDTTGRGLVAALEADGVDVTAVRRGGVTGTIVVLVDHTGERTMLSDRGASRGLADPDPRWLDRIDVLHVPLYSMVGRPLGETTTTLVRWAHERAIAVSVDASSVGLLDELGPATARRLIARLEPAVLLANADEAVALDLGSGASPLAPMTVVKRGPDPALVLAAGAAPIEVAVPPVGPVADTTGAGDAFAAGFLVARDGAGRRIWPVDPAAAAVAGHAAATSLLARR